MRFLSLALGFAPRADLQRPNKRMNEFRRKMAKVTDEDEIVVLIRMIGTCICIGLNKIVGIYRLRK